jgi:hypothetical protein
VLQNNTSNVIEGPFAYANWKAAEAGTPSSGAIEYPLFTDAHIVGEIASGLGPYQILNNVPITKRQPFAPFLTLRAEYHLQHHDLLAKREKTDVETYHGGLLNDEMAALVSLCLGIRLKSGGLTRRFEPGADPRGHPTAIEIFRDPVPAIPTGPSTVLPRALGEHRLDKAGVLASLPLISPSTANALIRAARLYQDAIWIAESEPHLSWVMLVSAIEAAAGNWRTAKESPVERLRDSKPDLATLLEASGDDELLRQVAEKIADYMGATKKFVDFIIEFLPEPPKDRPGEAFQHAWDSKSMKESLRIIYDWRSRALHGGTPYPLPMCEPPYDLGSGYIEKPVGLATEALGAYWVAKDTPMLLHTFEYIVRNTLLTWWAKSKPADTLLAKSSV